MEQLQAQINALQSALIGVTQAMAAGAGGGSGIVPPSLPAAVPAAVSPNLVVPRMVSVAPALDLRRLPRPLLPPRPAPLLQFPRPLLAAGGR